jgi:hypothetical protein
MDRNISFCITFEYEYDDNGNPIKCIRTSDDTICNYYITNNYNNNKLTKETYYDEYVNITSETEFNNNGDIEKQISYINNAISYYTEYEYNRDNNLIGESIYNSAGNLNFWIEFIYE